MKQLKIKTPEGNSNQVTKLFYFVFTAIAVIVVFGIVYFSNHLWLNETDTTPEAAVSLTQEQFHNDSTYLISSMKKDGMKATFDYVANQVTTNPSFAKDCHPLLHMLGVAAYEHYGGYEQAIEYQNEVCDSGYTHGVLEAYLSSTPDITQALNTACAATAPKSFKQWQCFHGLGHGVMLANKSSVPKSIELCSNVPTKFSKDACVNGVFMQHFVIRSHSGKIPTTNPTSLNDCLNVDASYKATCYLYAPSAYLTVNDRQYESTLKWCKKSEARYVASCVGGVGTQAMKENIGNPLLASQICQMAEKSYISTCVRGAISLYTLFYASSSSAKPLCYNQFKTYQKVCEATISETKNSLKI